MFDEFGQDHQLNDTEYTERIVNNRKTIIIESKETESETNNLTPIITLNLNYFRFTKKLRKILRQNRGCYCAYTYCNCLLSF